MMLFTRNLAQPFKKASYRKERGSILVQMESIYYHITKEFSFKKKNLAMHFPFEHLEI